MLLRPQGHISREVCGQKDLARLSELTTNKENLEKYARDQFLMKKSNEDVFVVIEEKDKKAKK